MLNVVKIKENRITQPSSLNINSLLSFVDSVPTLNNLDQLIITCDESPMRREISDQQVKGLGTYCIYNTVNNGS